MESWVWLHRDLLRGAGWTQHGVDLPMLNEVAVVNEVLAAFLTFVRPLPGVNSLVLEEHRAPTEALTALSALEGPLPRVDPEVMEEAGILTEGLAAHGALVALLPGVEPLVLEQARPLAEGPPTLIALVGLLPCVGSLVLDQDGVLGEALATFTTDIWPLHRRACPLPFQSALMVTGVRTLRHPSSTTIQFLRYFHKRSHFFRKLPLWS